MWSPLCNMHITKQYQNYHKQNTDEMNSILVISVIFLSIYKIQSIAKYSKVEYNSIITCPVLDSIIYLKHKTLPQKLKKLKTLRHKNW